MSQSIIKAYYLMRADLNMSQAKFGVQIAHGTDFIWYRRDENEYFGDWVNEFCRRKIVLKVNTLEKLENLHDILHIEKIKHSRIEDNGLTEFEGKTFTGIVILPIEERLLPKNIKKLQLWRDL